MHRGCHLHDEPCQGGSAVCHHGASRGRCSTRHRCQCGQRERLRTGRHGERSPHGKGSGQTARRSRDRCCRCIHRCDRSAPQHRVHRGAPAGAGSGGQRLRKGEPRHHDHRHQAQDGGCRVHHRRQDLPHRRYLQGQRHDPPEHGHHAVVHHDRLRHHARNADRRAAGECQENLQPRNG